MKNPRLHQIDRGPAVGPDQSRRLDLRHDSWILAFAAATGLIVLLHAALFFRFRVDAAVLSWQLWLTPLLLSFFALSAFGVAILVLGRHHVLRDASSYWTGLAFLAFAVSSLFYAVSLPAAVMGARLGVLGASGTSQWVIAPARSIFCLCLLAAAIELRLPSRVFLQKTRSVILWFASFVVLLGILATMAERLPRLSRPNGAFTPWMLTWHGILFVLFACGAGLSLQRYRRTLDRLSMYVAFVQVVLAIADVSAILSGSRFTVVLMFDRALLFLSVAGVLFALLADYAVLFRRDRERAQEEQARLAALRHSEARFRALAEAMPALFFVANAKGQNTYANPPFSQYTGLGPGELLDDRWLQALHPDDRERAYNYWADAVRRGASYGAEYRFRRYDGAYRWFLVRGSPMFGPDGRILDWFGTCIDIHDRKQAEHALQQSNEDLRQLIWAAGHDLQEPIRLVTTSAQFLLRREGDRLSSDGKQLAAAVLSGARRMQALVSSLRSFWQASEEREYQLESVSVADALGEAIAPLQDEIVDAGAQVLHDLLPVVQTERKTLVEVLRQLVENAIRYRSYNRPLLLQIAVQRENEDWCFRVTDNGLGIAPEYREQIFGLFKRLHRHDQIPGSGMGLAYCRRLVEQSGGRIWVEAAHGNGATFCFTLPVTPRERSRREENQHFGTTG